MNALRKITTLLAAGILATGCVVEVDFEPIGGSVAVDGAWTINGFTPDAALCSDAGIAEVELRIYESIGFAERAAQSPLRIARSAAFSRCERAGRPRRSRSRSVHRACCARRDWGHSLAGR